MGVNWRCLIVLCLILIVCTACSQPQKKIVAVVPKPVEPLVNVTPDNISEQEENITTEPINPYLAHNYSDVFNHSQLPTSKENEMKRYRTYGTLIDLGNLTKETCGVTINKLDNDIIKSADDIEDAKKDVAEAQTYTNEQYSQKDKADESGDIYKIEDENEDVREAEQWLWEEKEKLTNAERYHTALEETLVSVEYECDRLGYKEK